MLSSGDYLPEQAHHNDLAQSVSIMERSSKFLFLIYLELLRIIRPLELPDSYKKRSRRSNMRIDEHNLN